MRTHTWSDSELVYQSMYRRGMDLTKRYWMFLTICEAVSMPRPGTSVPEDQYSVLAATSFNERSSK